MRGSWKVKVLSGVSVLAIAGMSAAVLAAEQNKARQVMMQEEMLQGTRNISENVQTSIEEIQTWENLSQENDRTMQGEMLAAERENRQEDVIQTFSGSLEEGTEAAETSASQENEPPSPEKKSTIKLPITVTEEEIDAYFDQTVLVGDSVMMGFRNYAMRRANTYLGRIQFLASGSFSVHNALWPVNAKSVHPIYQGQQRPVWESLGMIQPKRVFLFFGLNDMNMGTLEETCSLYSQVIANIQQTCPDAEIHLISMTYTLRGKGKGNLTNPNIRTFNEMLKQMARDNGWGFVDMANPLADANGDLAPEYCSDHYVHQTNAAYDVWSVVLRDYARSQLDESSEFFVGEKKPVNVEAAGYGEIRADEQETEVSERQEIFGTSINP